MREPATKFEIHVVDQDRTFYCSSDKNLLVGMERFNTDCIDVGCRGGGCGVCKIKVLEGTYISKRMSKAHISEQDLEEGIVLACRIFPDSDMKITVEQFQSA